MIILNLNSTKSFYINAIQEDGNEKTICLLPLKEAKVSQETFENLNSLYPDQFKKIASDDIREESKSSKNKKDKE